MLAMRFFAWRFVILSKTLYYGAAERPHGFLAAQRALE